MTDWLKVHAGDYRTRDGRFHALKRVGEKGWELRMLVDDKEEHYKVYFLGSFRACRVKAFTIKKEEEKVLWQQTT